MSIMFERAASSYADLNGSVQQLNHHISPTDTYSNVNANAVQTSLHSNASRSATDDDFEMKRRHEAHTSQPIAKRRKDEVAHNDESVHISGSHTASIVNVTQNRQFDDDLHTVTVANLTTTSDIALVASHSQEQVMQNLIAWREEGRKRPFISRDEGTRMIPINADMTAWNTLYSRVQDKAFKLLAERGNQVTCTEFDYRVCYTV